MFPTATSTVYRNEDGEVLGWDNDYGFEPEYDEYDGYYEPDEDECQGCGQYVSYCKCEDETYVAEDAHLDGTWEE